MGVNIISVRCPDCGAMMPIEEGRNQMYCSYCGSSIIITNDNEHIYRNVDEAKVKLAEAEIKKAEAEKEIKLKKLEIIEKERESDKHVKKIKIIISIILGIVGIFQFFLGSEISLLAGMVSLTIIMYIWIFSAIKDNNKDDLDLGDKAKVPSVVNKLEDINYKEMESAFRSAGFVNIKCVPLNNLTFGLLKKPSKVESVRINGENITCGGKKIDKNAEVVISYHSLSR